MSWKRLNQIICSKFLLLILLATVIATPVKKHYGLNLPINGTSGEEKRAPNTPGEGKGELDSVAPGQEKVVPVEKEGDIGAPDTKKGALDIGTPGLEKVVPVEKEGAIVQEKVPSTILRKEDANILNYQKTNPKNETANGSDQFINLKDGKAGNDMTVNQNGNIDSNQKSGNTNKSNEDLEHSTQETHGSGTSDEDKAALDRLASEQDKGKAATEIFLNETSVTGSPNDQTTKSTDGLIELPNDEVSAKGSKTLDQLHSISRIMANKSSETNRKETKEKKTVTLSEVKNDTKEFNPTASESNKLVPINDSLNLLPSDNTSTKEHENSKNNQPSDSPIISKSSSNNSSAATTTTSVTTTTTSTSLSNFDDLSLLSDKAPGITENFPEDEINSDEEKPISDNNLGPLNEEEKTRDDEFNRNAIKKQTSKKPEVFPEEKDSHFFAYFVTGILVFAIGYLVVHNKQKILGLIVEGRTGRARRRSHAYKRLENEGAKFSQIF